jgi:hypothetical protein
MKSVSKKIDERVRIQMRNQIGLVLDDQVNTNVRHQVQIQIWGQVTNQLQIQIWGQVNRQVWIQLSDQLHRQLSNPHKQNKVI